MQGTSGRSYSDLCFALNNAAHVNLRLARRVKMNELRRIFIHYFLMVFNNFWKFAELAVIKYYLNFSFIFTHDSGVKFFR